MEMTVSEIQVVPIKPKGGLVGFASIVLNNNFYIGSIGIFTRPHGGYRLTYPTRKSSNHSLPIFHPINKNAANLVEQAVICKFEEIINGYNGLQASGQHEYKIGDNK
jgi:DNA-binding cell septation regulator SpoVG